MSLYSALATVRAIVEAEGRVEAARALLEALRRDFHPQAVCIYGVSEPSPTLELLAHAGLSSSAAERLRTLALDEQTLVGRAVRSGELRAADSPTAQANPDLQAMGASGFGWALPLKSDATAVGAVVGLSPKALSGPERQSLEDLVAIAAHALRRYTPEVEGRSKLDQASLAVAEALRILPPAHMRVAVQRGFQQWYAPPNENLPQSLRTILRVVVRQARMAAGAQMGALGIGDVPELPFEPWVFDGVPVEAEQRVGRHPRPVGTLGVVACQGQVVRVADVKEHPAFQGLPPGHPEVRSLLGIPIRYGEQVLGNLYLANKVGASEFTEEDERAVQVLASYAGIALQQTYLRAAVETQQARLETILESAPHGILFIDSRSGRVMANTRATQLMGRPIDPLRGREQYASLLRHPDGRIPSPEELACAPALRGAQPAAVEWTLIQPGGTQLSVVERAAPVWGFENQVLGAVVSLEDRSADKALERLRADLDAMEVLGSATFEGIALVEGGVIAQANQQLAEMFRCGREALIGRRPLDLVAEQTRQKAAELPPDAPLPLAFIAQRADGSTFPCEQRSRRMGRDGHSWQVCAMRDVTEQKRVEEALRTSDRRKSEFLAVLSHELRNPLTPIRNSLHLLTRAPADSPQHGRALDIIQRQVTQLAHLIDDLLDITRINRGKIELKRERLDLNQVVQRTVDDYRSVFSERGVELEWAPVAHRVWAEGDLTRLTQVVGNLLHNAAKFTPRGGRTFVSVQEDALHQQVQIQVQDTGRGMTAAMMARLFEPFSQADTSLERVEGGLGLGLALVKGLVAMHGGTVSAQSPGLDQGSTFTVTLPAATTHRSSGVTQDATHPAVGAHRVLVIEDNADAAESLRDALRLSEHQVEVAYDGAQGLRQAQTFMPDVVICDLGLPGMDGFAVARAIRADPALREIRLVALSGYAQPADVNRAREAGFDAHLAKPPTLEQLEQALSGGWAQ